MSSNAGGRVIIVIIPSEVRLYSGSIEIFRRRHRCRHRQPEVGLKTMVYGITVRLVGMKPLVVIKQQCTNCIGSPRETHATLKYL